ncbi:MAG: DUF2213 domain-containing protein [Myxococcota bacterium]
MGMSDHASTSRLVFEHRRDSLSGAVEERVDRRGRGILKSAYKTAQGFIIADGVGAVAGIHTYRSRDADGNIVTVRELLDDEVLRQDAGQIGRLPVPNDHPPLGTDVTPDNADQLVAGDVGDRVHYEEDAQGGFVRVSVCLRRKDAIEDFEAGKTGLSFGYTAWVDKTPGEHPRYGRYDQRQTRRVYNHLALVDNPRHGPDAHLRTDARLRGDVGAVAPTLPDSVPDGVGVVVSLSRRFDSIAEPAPPSSTPSEPSMDPTLIALAMALGISRADGQSERDYAAQIVSTVAALKNTAERLRADAADTPDHSEVVQAATAKLTAALKGEEKYRDSMSVAELAALMVETHDGLKGELQAAQDAAGELRKAEEKREADAERTRLDSFVEARRIDVSDEVKKGDLSGYRRAVASKLTTITKDDSDPFIAAYLEGMMRQQASQAGQRADGKSGKDDRYDGFRSGGGKSGNDGGGGSENRVDADDEFFTPGVHNIHKGSAA